MKENYTEIIRPLLKPERFQHSVNVAEQAVHLAKLYHEDEALAWQAGVLHDICKDMSSEKQLQWIKKSAIILDSNLLAQPQVWHGIAASGYLQQELGIFNPDVLNAVRYHTTAREGMGKLEQIVYLADLTSRERQYPDVLNMRRVVEQSLEIGMHEALCFSIKDLAAKGKPICNDTCSAYNQYLYHKTVWGQL